MTRKTSGRPTLGLCCTRNCGQFPPMSVQPKYGTRVAMHSCAWVALVGMNVSFVHAAGRDCPGEEPVPVPAPWGHARPLQRGHGESSIIVRQRHYDLLHMCVCMCKVHILKYMSVCCGCQVSSWAISCWGLLVASWGGLRRAGLLVMPCKRVGGVCGSASAPAEGLHTGCLLNAMSP
jgi:hypothetical protein